MPDGNRFALKYDDFSRLVEEVDPLGRNISYEHHLGTLDKLRGEIKYEYEANGQLRSRDTGSLIGSEEFRYDAAANRLDFNARQFDKQWRDQEYRYDPWGNQIEKREAISPIA
ncbi:hypothetical protein PspTeo4_11264 [Pseudomonas sp. Teo4]|nr:hypothetical protein [Pseudomonas sp. Teo4]